MAEIGLKTVEYAQFEFDHRFWLNFRQNWPQYFQTGRFSPKSVHGKPAMN
jgi:hypothetical protein